MTITKPYCVPSGRRCFVDLPDGGPVLDCDWSRAVRYAITADTISGTSIIPNDNAGPLSPAAKVLAERIKRAATADWQHLRHDVQVKLIELHGNGLINDGAYELLAELIKFKDRKVWQSSGAVRGTEAQLETVPDRISRAQMRLALKQSNGTSARMILSEEQLAERAEKRGTRHYLAKSSVSPAEIMREGQYSIGIQAVLARIVWEFINTGKCEKTVALLAKESGTSERTVQMAVRRAQADGLIDVQVRLRQPNRITIIDRKWLKWINTWIARRAAQEDSYGVSFKGAKSCTLTDDDSTQTTAATAQRVGGPGSSRNTSHGFSRSLPCDPAALSSRIDRRPTNRFEEHLAELERSVLAQAASAVTCDANGVVDAEELYGIVPLNGDPTLQSGGPTYTTFKETNGSSD
ncbi:hypothetical protein [Methylobacterium sp. 17Sr1-1]|uniref:hypothetical protein n=1 Tax=Methylobacterium sp. 17Sr1-1 TaxID=2202826 RepID=UPI0013A565D8|nr:hypothetical protein [Methylobacterium sp. 17Sr1-1]